MDTTIYLSIGKTIHETIPENTDDTFDKSIYLLTPHRDHSRTIHNVIPEIISSWNQPFSKHPSDKYPHCVLGREGYISVKHW